jgi:hypothetical protein
MPVVLAHHWPKASPEEVTLQDHPLWHDTYKSMSPAQLVAELARIARHPHHYDERLERRLFITTELVLRDHRPTRPIIVMETE